MELVSPTMQAVARSMDGFSLRHQAIANNIANINTPGYVKQEVNFEESLLTALEEHDRPSASSYEQSLMDGIHVTDSHNNPLLSWEPRTSKAPDAPQRLDGNRTPVESEMSAMAMNTVKYNAVAAAVQKDFQLLRTIAQSK